MPIVLSDKSKQQLVDNTIEMLHGYCGSIDAMHAAVTALEPY
jgi:hypothetical protein